MDESLTLKEVGNLLAIVVAIGIVPAAIAYRKGESFFAWWLYGAALWIIALPHALIMKPNKAALERRQLAEGMKKCVHCAELIKSDANLCRYCHREVLAAPEARHP